MNPLFDEKNFLSAVSRSFKNYQSHGARSTEKLKPLHKYLAETLLAIFGDDFSVHFMGENSREMTVPGKYYPKDIDITVCQKGNPVFCLGVKFVTSNFKQNANNYFETMMGETANIQARRDLHYAQFIILRYETPYYRRDGSVKNMEIIGEKHLQKYLNLIFDTPQAHRPEMTAIVLVAIDEETGVCQRVNYQEKYRTDLAALLEESLSMAGFLQKIMDFKHFLSLKTN